MLVAAARRSLTNNGVLQEASRRRITAFTQQQKPAIVTAAYWTNAPKTVQQALRKSLQRTRARVSIYTHLAEQPIIKEVVKRNAYKFGPDPCCVLNKDDVLCDIGKHVSIRIVLALKTSRHATAVEPWPRTLRILKKNMACFGSTVRVIGTAV